MTEQAVRLLDGSMGEELINRGFASRGGLWSAKALLDHPAEVERLHRDYIAAGAQYITTNTYSTIPSYLDKEGLGDKMGELAALAGRLARQAAGDSDAEVIGSLPPLDESYRPDLVPDEGYSAPIYRKLIDCLVDSVDLFLAETMSSIDEALHVVRIVREHPKANSKRLIVSFTLEDIERGYVRSGETVKQAVDAMRPFEPIAILVNCSTPESILNGIRQAKDCGDIETGGYPNRFRPVPPEWSLDNEQEIERDDDLTVETFVEWSRQYIDAGATYLGGCCGIGPKFIQGLKDAIGAV